MGTIRRSLFDLEAQHERAHTHYEDEIKRIRSELLAVRQSGTAPVSLGIPGRSPRQLGAAVSFPNTPAMSEAQVSNSQLLRHRALERDLPDRELWDRSRDPVERDLDRVGDQHDVKRQKTRRNMTGSCFWPRFSNFVFLIFPKTRFFFKKKKVLNFLRGVQVLMHPITPLGCSASPRVQRNVLTTLRQQLLWLMNSNSNILHQNT